MKIFRSRLSLLISVAIAIGAILCVYGLQTRAADRIKGVTITARIYELKADGTITQRGTKTTYISAKGSWRTVKTSSDGKIEQILIADASRHGVFGVDLDKHEAAKVAEFNPKDTPYFDADGYRNHPQFAGEETLLGFKGFIQRLTSPEGKIEAELTFIPEFDALPIKEVQHLDDGTRRIVEPTKIIVGEPAANLFQLPPDFPTRDALLNQSNGQNH